MSLAGKPGLVSVVVASYNHVRFLRQRMDSLVGQTYPDIEILVIDDCSPENNLEILAGYETDLRVKVIRRQKNGGWVVVSNQGIDMAQGEFLLFANCDDDCDPRMIERLVTAITPHPQAGVAFCRSMMIDGSDRILGDDYEIREKAFRDRCVTDVLIGRDEMRRFLFHSCVIPNLSGTLFRRTCFDHAGPFSAEYKACSDWILFFKLAETFDFCYVAEPMNRFRQHDKTIRSATRGRITYDEFFRVLLGEIGRGGLTADERFRYRLQVMYIWAVDLVRPSLAGWSDILYLFRLVWRLDPFALPLLPLAMLKRVVELPGKAFRRLVRIREAGA